MIGSPQFHFRHKKYVIKFRWGFSLLCLFLFGLCVALGIWQLHRYAYKKELLTSYQHRQTEAAKKFQDIVGVNRDLQFQAVQVEGHYQNSGTVLLQNRFYHGELGYEVFTPLQIPNDKKFLLVDRGWIKKPQANTLPQVSAATQLQKIKGHIKLSNEYQFILGKNILVPEDKPLIAQRLDIAELSRILHQHFYPFVLRLNGDEKEGFVRDWTVVTVMPARHMMYAIQWFLLALVVLIAYFCFCCEEETDAKNI